MAVGVEHDRLVKAVQQRLGLGEGRVDIRAGDLGAGRDHVVVHALPGGNAHVEGAVYIYIIAERLHGDVKLVAQVMQAHADHFVGFVGHRADISVRVEAAARATVARELHNSSAVCLSSIIMMRVESCRRW